MADTEEKSGEQEMSLDDVAAWMKENAPKWKKMQDMMEKHFGKAEDMAEMPATEPETQAVTARDNEEKEKARDAEEEKEEMKGEDESEKEEQKSEAKDEDEKKETKDEEEAQKKKAASDAKAASKAMDAALTRVKTLETDLGSLKKNGVKSLMQEISRRTELASKISSFTGAFDHSEMTVTEVAAYGVKKLGLKAPAGQEMVALDAYFINRTPVTQEVGFALDHQAAADAKGNAVEEFYSQQVA